MHHSGKYQAILLHEVMKKDIHLDDEYPFIFVKY